MKSCETFRLVTEAKYSCENHTRQNMRVRYLIKKETFFFFRCIGYSLCEATKEDGTWFTRCVRMTNDEERMSLIL